jgi:heme-degrading monooxygenase HmoA
MSQEVAIPPSRMPPHHTLEAYLDAYIALRDAVRNAPYGEVTDMHMRIIWGKILPGQWDAFEAAFKKALEIRGEAKGLKSQWLLRDQNDPNAGYSISQWESEEDMRAFWDSKRRSDAMAVIQPFFVNQFTITNCEVRIP